MVGYKSNPYLEFLIKAPFYLLAITMFIPYYWMVTGSFKTIAELVKVPPTFLVQNPTVKNFFNSQSTEPNQWLGLFQRYTEGLGFWGFYLNSLLITSFVVTVSLMLASIVAFILVKYPFPGSKFLFMVLLASMMIPWEVTIIPNFLTISALNWINTPQALMLPGLAKAFVVFYFRQSILSIPTDIIDAAKIDGASVMRTWWSVALPMLRPAIAAIAIPVALGEWGNFLWPLLVINDDAHSTLPLALGRLAGNLATDPKAQGVVLAASLITSLPAVILFLMFQRQFIQGLTSGATKG